MVVFMRKVRPIRIDGDVAYITLTKGYEAVIDAIDVPIVEGFNWYVHSQAHTSYARREDNSCGKTITVYMHRVILGIPFGSEGDHKDGNGLNNRRDNLREASRAQNNQNRGLYKSNTSGIKGVRLHKSTSKWIAQINAGGRRISLGFFSSVDDACAAYRRAQSEYHMDFSRDK
jgi:hypothetical protein